MRNYVIKENAAIIKRKLNEKGWTLAVRASRDKLMADPTRDRRGETISPGFTALREHTRTLICPHGGCCGAGAHLANL